jgi:hypothetical protein
VARSAGWASFTHVHDWTMHHAPADGHSPTENKICLAGTPDLFGWVNAVISELVPVAAFLTIRRRRRTGAPIGYPLALLIAAASLSLLAQLAVAQRSPSGSLLSAVPALAFMALVTLIFTTTPTDTDAPAVPPSAASADVPAEPHHAAAAPPHASRTRATSVRPGVVPVPASMFTRLNGVPVIPEAAQ